MKAWEKWEVRVKDFQGKGTNRVASVVHSMSGIKVPSSEILYEGEQVSNRLKLIAAAPDLLAAAENLENDSGKMMPESAWNLLQDAIEKAGGQRK